MAVLIIVIVGIWIGFSALVVTVACMNSARISQAEDSFGRRSTRARAPKRKIETGVQPTSVPASAE
jgi:hypothetical protein